MNNITTQTLSFQGRRETNQDCYSILEIQPNIIFLAVADGMGGVAGGKKASETVIKCCEIIIKDKFKTDKSPDLKQLLRKIFFESQNAIKKEIQKNAELNGMGTTLTCVLIMGDKFVWGNLGDSRIYYFSESKLKLITKDHTHIQEYIDEKEAPLTQSMVDNYGNFLTRSIDGGSDEPDIFPEILEHKKIKKGEAFLLCSDGLVDNKAKDNTIFLRNIIIGTKDLKEAAKVLVEGAFKNGSTDNITVVLLEKGSIRRKKINLNQVNADRPSFRSNTRVNKRKNNNISKVFIGLFILVLAAIVMVLINKKLVPGFEITLHKNESSQNHKSPPQKISGNNTEVKSKGENSVGPKLTKDSTKNIVDSLKTSEKLKDEKQKKELNKKSQKKKS